MKRIICIIISLIMALPMIVGCNGKSKTVEVNFGKKDGYAVQNLKKFDNFTSTWAWTGETTGSVDATSLKTVPALDEIKAESLRFDLFMGYHGLGYNIGRNGKDGTTEAEYLQTMQLVNKLVDNRILPYIVYFASPEYCTSGSWKTPPAEDKWEQLCYNIASYFKSKGIRLAAHEIWNEPDFNGSFFSGDWEDYIKTYIAGYKGIKRANPDATLSAMSVAYAFDRFNKKTTIDGVAKTDWQRFIEATYENYMADAISWHYYGREGDILNRLDETENLSYYLDSVRNALKGYQDGSSSELAEGVSYPNLETLQQHLDEFNIYQPGVDDIYQTVRMLPGMFTAFKTLLSATDVTRVSWAALVGEKNDGLSYDLIDGLSYQRYPAYHALWMYARLPVDRVNVDLGNKNLETMAGVDSSRAGMIVYNNSDKTQEIDVKLKGIPFDKGNLNVYLVDKNHYSYSTQNAPIKVRERKNIPTDGIIVKMQLEPNSAYYVEVNDESGKSEIENYSNFGKIVRKDYWYPNRGDNMPYSDMHENSFIAHVGMANNAEGKSAMAVTVDGLKEKQEIDISYETWGDLIRSSNSTLGLKIEYQKANGAYCNSTLYTVSNYNYNLITPLGSKTAAEKVVSMGDMNGTYHINLSETAPSDWTGRVIISYLIQDAGKGATGKFIIK